jgi:Ser/Thr protein kinase RdoA (MazF antagonist)
MSHLYENNILIGTPVPRRDGTHTFTIAAPEGTRYGLLTRYIPGRLFGEDEQQLEQFRILGVFVGRMHACLDALPADFTPVHWNLYWLVDRSLEQLAPVLADRPADRAFLHQVGATIVDRITSLLPLHPPEYGLVHGDLHQNNLHYDPQSGFGLTDAESFGYGWRAWELVYLVLGHLKSWDRQAVDAYERRWPIFLDGYTHYRRLSDAEIAASCVFVLARYLLALGRRAILGARFDGQSALDTEQLAAWIDFMKRWIDRYRPF